MNKPNISHLTEKEKQVWRMLVKGTSLKEVGFALDLGERMLNFRAGNIYKKMGVSGQVELILQNWRHPNGDEARFLKIIDENLKAAQSSITEEHRLEVWAKLYKPTEAR